MPIDVKAMNIDMLSLSAHKFHGPKGVGALYVRRGIRLPSHIMGGAQERGRRAGTENTAGIVGLGAAIELACSNMEENARRMTALRNRLMEGIEREIPYVKLNGHRTERLPNNVNYSIKFIEGESILLMLDMNGIAASSGSACTSGSLDPSHVLLARSDMVSFVDSLVGPLSILNALIVTVAIKKKNEVADTLRKIEEIWDEYGVYEKVDEKGS